VILLAEPLAIYAVGFAVSAAALPSACQRIQLLLRLRPSLPQILNLALIDRRGICKAPQGKADVAGVFLAAALAGGLGKSRRELFFKLVISSRELLTLRGV
jgi:hypothetical protein